MKKGLLILITSILLLFCGGCAHSVDRLIADEKYEEALVIIEENPKQYSDVYDEVRYYAAQNAFTNNEFDKAVYLLQDNNFDQAVILLDEAKYNLALNLYNNGEYSQARIHLENNSYDDASSLLDDVKYELAKNAIDMEEYEDAINLLHNNKNANAASLLSHVINLKTAVEIEACYNEMLHEIEEYNPDKWTPNFDYMEVTDFYLRIADMLNATYNIIVRDNSLSNAQENFVEVFGYEATSVASAKLAINNLKEELEFDAFYDSPYCYYFVLDYVMDSILKNTDAVRFEMTDTCGYAIIERPYRLIHQRDISAKTLAYLLGTCEGFGGKIERDENRIIISFENIESGDYYSRGYYYCAPKSQHSKLRDFYDDYSVEIYDSYVDADGLTTTFEISTTRKFPLKCISLNIILKDKYDSHLYCTSKLIENVDEQVITFDAFFEGISMDDLPDSELTLTWFIAAVMNE